MKIWITKYYKTKGIIEANTKEFGDGRSNTAYVYFEGNKHVTKLNRNEWFPSKTQAENWIESESENNND